MKLLSGRLTLSSNLYFFPVLLRDRLGDMDNGNRRWVLTGKKHRTGNGERMTEVQQVKRLVGPVWFAIYPPFYDYDGNFIP